MIRARPAIPQLLDRHHPSGLELPVRPAPTARIPVPGLRGRGRHDTYRSLIHFPFVATAPDGVHTLEKGTPLVQCIPFRRETAAIEGEIGPETKDEAETRERIRRLTGAGEGWYRTEARAKR